MKNSRLTGVRILCSVFYVLFSVFCLLSLAGCARKDTIYRESRILMDTLCTITVVSPSKENAKDAIEAGFAEIKRLERLLNYFSPESEISKITGSSGIAPVKVNKDTLDVIKKAIEIANYTNGAFDPTIGPLIRLWRFSSANPSVPSQAQIKKASRFVDYRKIRINAKTSEVFLEMKGMEIDLGGIAKGYAADKAVEAIKAKGINAALVAVAGDIKGFGLKPDGLPWKVGIQNPRPTPKYPPLTMGDLKGGKRGQSAEGKNEEDVLATLYLKDSAISTSGDYERFFIKNGKRYHHIINPRTGYPAIGVISVSVIAHEGYLSDGLSTGIFVLGVEKGLKLLESLGIDGVIVDSNKNIFLTNNLKGKINYEKAAFTMSVL